MAVISIKVAIERLISHIQQAQRELDHGDTLKGVKARLKSRSDVVRNVLNRSIIKECNLASTCVGRYVMPETRFKAEFNRGLNEALNYLAAALTSIKNRDHCVLVASCAERITPYTKLGEETKEAVRNDNSHCDPGHSHKVTIGTYSKGVTVSVIDNPPLNKIIGYQLLKLTSSNGSNSHDHMHSILSPSHIGINVPLRDYIMSMLTVHINRAVTDYHGCAVILCNAPSTAFTKDEQVKVNRLKSGHYTLDEFRGLIVGLYEEMKENDKGSRNWEVQEQSK